MPDQKAGISEVICVCSWGDAPTWEKAAGRIVRNISARHYKLLVPDSELDRFRAITPSAIQVLPESLYLGDIASRLNSAIPPERMARRGWYLQQFIKIAAARAADPDDVVLIWDADTVPLKPLRFIDEAGRVLYYRGSEHHLPYFTLIRDLLGLERKVDFSFIAQCFPLRVRWLHELCGELEQRYNSTWYEAIISRIDFSQDSGFSEYETMGTYIAHHHPQEIAFSSASWWRFGNRLVGDITLLTDRKAKALSRKFDFLSFEKWERKPSFMWLRKLLSR